LQPRIIVNSTIENFNSGFARRSVREFDVIVVIVRNWIDRADTTIIVSSTG